MTTTGLPPDPNNGSVLTIQSALRRAQGFIFRHPQLPALIALVSSFSVLSLFSNGRFGSPETTGILLQQTAVLATVAIGQTLVVISNRVDLAAGAATLFTHLVVARLAVDLGVPSLISFFLGLALGVAIGAFHADLTRRLSLPSFVVTLGSALIFGVAAGAVGQGTTFTREELGGVDSFLLLMGKGLSFGSMKITFGVLLALALYVAFGIAVSRTESGQQIYAAGAGVESARQARVEIGRVVVGMFLVAGFLYGVASWIQLGQAQSASQDELSPWSLTLYSIAAVTIGGTSLFGGRGKLWGSLVGALFVAVLRFGMSLVPLPDLVQHAVIAMLILGAVGLDLWTRRGTDSEPSVMVRNPPVAIH